MRLLDLYCGAGGAAMGYHLAGFDEIVGVDINPQPHYPFEFVQGDALEYLDTQPIAGPFDAIHASPPCPKFSSITAVSGNRDNHPDLLTPTLEWLRLRNWIPWVVENVERAHPMNNPVRLCGATMCPTIIEDGEVFWLRRHRLFETNFPLLVPPCSCSRHIGTVLGIYGGGTRQDTRKEANPTGGNTRKANLRQGQALMGTPWMNRREMTQAIPPAYTEYIGTQMLASMERVA